MEMEAEVSEERNVTFHISSLARNRERTVPGLFLEHEAAMDKRSTPRPGSPEREASAPVISALNKVENSFSHFSNHLDCTLEQAINDLSSIRQELSERLEARSGIAAAEGSGDYDDSDLATKLRVQSKRCTDTLGMAVENHKNIHASVSRIGKNIDKNFVNDYSGIMSPNFLALPEHRADLHHMINEHFLRSGLLDISEKFVEEAELDVTDDERQPFLEMHRILESLDRHDLQPALDWVLEKRCLLSERGSNLEFLLHRERYLEILCSGRPRCESSALQYLRTHVAPSCGATPEKVKQLTGCMLFAKSGLHRSPYAHLFAPSVWDELSKRLRADVCRLLGLSSDGPLTVCLLVGCRSLPPLLKIKAVMEHRLRQTGWSAKDELPIEIALEKKHQYHSVFACPILRQQSTPQNLPMRLGCGHVISHDALSRLAHNNKVKCPYCPELQSRENARPIFL